ncbi:MAG: MerR family transcriptional regulator [Cyanobacteria bacterium]|nr:MerR family transcriptional regulator [Cyanobacteriota bacterium]
MSKQAASMSIGALARTASVNVETIRFYQRKGLLVTPGRIHGQIRRYTVDDVGRVKFVKAAKTLGFSLDEIGDLLSLEDGTRCDEARDMALQKLADVRKRQLELRRIESALEKVVADCSAPGAKRCCPFIAALQIHV